MTSNAQVMTVANEGLIVFASARGEDLYCDCSYQIYAMNPDGSNVQQLTDPGLFPYGAWNPVLSPDGQKIAFTYGQYWDIFVMDVDGSNPINLTNHIPYPDDEYNGPEQIWALADQAAWSPDGTKIAFVQQDWDSSTSYPNAIWVMNTDGSNPMKIYESEHASGWQYPELYPAWSPDGSKLAFNDYFQRDGDWYVPQIFTMNADGSNVTCLMCEPITGQRDVPRWSPDGQLISYRLWNNAILGSCGSGIGVSNADGSNQNIVYSTPIGCPLVTVLGPADWSPGGNKLAFAQVVYSGANPFEQIHTMNADGSDVTNISNNSFDDVQPDWGIAADICEPSGSALRSGAVSPMSACQAPTPTPTATLTVDQQIEQYNVSLSGDWSADDRLELLKGLQATGQALSLQFGGGEYPDAFRRVMFQAGATSILFNRTTTNSYTCQTFNLPGGGLQARIDCDPNVSFTQYVAVHELGHVFEGRMGGTQLGATYYGLLKQPPPTGVVVDYGNEGTPPGIVFGNRLDPVNLTPDWVRGNRGWGSAALPITSTYFCDFQQDPYSVQDWLVTATPGQPNQIREVDEAAADMFLNWVYSKIGSGGFQNTSWIGITSCVTGTPQPTERPGDTRDNFMNNVVMPTIATYVPTPTPTPTP